MSLVLVANEGLSAKIRNRMEMGAAVRETAAEDMPLWLAAEVGEAAVEAVFESEFAAVAVLENGRSVVKRAPR